MLRPVAGGGVLARSLAERPTSTRDVIATKGNVIVKAFDDVEIHRPAPARSCLQLINAQPHRSISR